MPDLSVSFDPNKISAASDAASDAASKAIVAQSTGSDASSAATVAMSKASDASSAVAALSDAASDAVSKATAAMSKASDASSAAAAASDAASNAQSKITARSAVWDMKTIIIKVYPEAVAIASGDGKAYFTIPAALNGMNLVSAGGHLYTAATSGVVAVQIANVTSAVDMLSAAKKLEWDVTEKDTATAAAASAAVIDTAADGVATGEEIRIDIDDAASGAAGLEVRLSFKAP